MKLILILLFELLSQSAYSQDRKPNTKIYFYCNNYQTIVTSNNLDEPIKIGNCTLIETDLDTLRIPIFKDKTALIPLEKGYTYYFRSMKEAVYTTAYTPAVVACSEQEFWINVAFAGIGFYRHYVLNSQTGLKLLEERKK